MSENKKTTLIPKKRHHKSSFLPKILVVGGIVLVAIVIFMLKDKSQAVSTSVRTNTLPEVQLQHALQVGQPTLAFYHSTNCHTCIVMMDIVAQVYPEYNDSITLVDVNVYDERNAQLLEKVGLQFIPTLVFYDHKGGMQVHVGAMEADQLRQKLGALSGDE